MQSRLDLRRHLNPSRFSAAIMLQAGQQSDDSADVSGESRRANASLVPHHRPRTARNRLPPKSKSFKSWRLTASPIRISSRWRQAMTDMRAPWAICRSVISVMAVQGPARSVCLRRHCSRHRLHRFGWSTIGRLRFRLIGRDSWPRGRTSHKLFR